MIQYLLRQMIMIQYLLNQLTKTTAEAAVATTTIIKSLKSVNGSVFWDKWEEINICTVNSEWISILQEIWKQISILPWETATVSVFTHSTENESVSFLGNCEWTHTCFASYEYISICLCVADFFHTSVSTYLARHTFCHLDQSWSWLGRSLWWETQGQSWDLARWEAHVAYCLQETHPSAALRAWTMVGNRRVSYVHCVLYITMPLVQ